jgi:hypothetical protein
MFQKKTVFVVGAGASHEFGLPVGDGLKTMIGARLPDYLGTDYDEEPSVGSVRLRHALSLTVDGRNLTDLKLATTVEQLAQGLPLANSIDQYLDFHRHHDELVIVGKMAIADSILTAEAQSALMLSDNKLQSSSLGGSWLPELFKLMHHGTEYSHPSDMFANVSFVCFNYDRCIEHFFFNAVGAYTNLEKQSVAQVINNGLKIVHPYGKIGRLPWQNKDDSPQAVEFGDADYDPRSLLQVARGLKTFTEQVEDNDATMLAAKAMIAEAQRIVFLGFSYLDQNMQYLTPSGTLDINTHMFGTVYGESDTNQYLAKSAMIQMGQGLSSSGPRNFTTTMQAVKAGAFIRNEGNALRR